MDNSNNYFVKSFIWSVFAKIADAAIRFISIPLLLTYFGKDNFGILTLAIATNAYIQLLDLGIGTGAIKFYAQWRAKGEHKLIDRVSRTSISFYGIIGIINAFILLIIAFWGEEWFQLTQAQFNVLQSFLILSALFSIINWITSVFSQLLIADEKMVFVQYVSLVRTVLNLAVILATVYINLTLNTYFLFYLLVNSFIIIPYFIKCKGIGLISSFKPQAHWKDFNVILKYSLAIFAMGIFQLTATKSRPIILSIFSNKGIGILTEYRIIEVFPLFIISIGGVLISIFLPRASKLISLNKLPEIREFAYSGTLYTSIIVSLLSFPVMISSEALLTLYVGSEYSHLSNWLVLWCFTLILSLHNSPVASLVLATGKTKMLVLSTAIASIISIILNSVLVTKFGVGSAVIGYLVYIIIQIFFYYLFFNNKVLNLNSWHVFKSFIVPTGIGILLFLLVQLIDVQSSYFFANSAIRIFLWLTAYIFVLLVFKVIDYKFLASIIKIK